MNKTMQGKQVLLTGGTGGLGLGVTPTLLAQGAKLTIPYQGEKGIQRLKERLSASEFACIRSIQTDLVICFLASDEAKDLTP